MLLSKGIWVDDIHKLPKEAMDIKVIAHSLSRLCRYAGHADTFYSVAQHSYFVSKLVPEEYALEGLLHDAAEMITSDIPLPVKKLIPKLKSIERSITKQIFKHYGIEMPDCKACMLHTEVHEADKDMIFSEMMVMFQKHHPKLFTWFSNNITTGSDRTPSLYRQVHFDPASIEVSYKLFIDRYEEILNAI